MAELVKEKLRDKLMMRTVVNRNAISFHRPAGGNGSFRQVRKQALSTTFNILNNLKKISHTILFEFQQKSRQILSNGRCEHLASLLFTAPNTAREGTKQHKASMLP